MGSTRATWDPPVPHGIHQGDQMSLFHLFNDSCVPHAGQPANVKYGLVLALQLLVTENQGSRKTITHHPVQSRMEAFIALQNKDGEKRCL